MTPTVLWFSPVPPLSLCVSQQVDTDWSLAAYSTPKDGEETHGGW